MPFEVSERGRCDPPDPVARGTAIGKQPIETVTISYMGK
jgi:hypothetical protein